MDIGPLNRVNIAAPVTPAPAAQENPATTRQIVTAIKALNESELMGPNRQFTYTRDPKTQQPVVQIVERETGDVVDQLPPEAILRMRQELAQAPPKGES